MESPLKAEGLRGGGGEALKRLSLKETKKIPGGSRNVGSAATWWPMVDSSQKGDDGTTSAQAGPQGRGDPSRPALRRPAPKVRDPTEFARLKEVIHNREVGGWEKSISCLRRNAPFSRFLSYRRVKRPGYGCDKRPKRRLPNGEADSWFLHRVNI